MFFEKNDSRKLVGSEGERAVSPVIGVILMVAITVILAAVIAAFVLGMGPGDESITASADVSGDGTDTVDITVANGGNADYVVLVESGTGTVASDSHTATASNAPVAEDANTGATYTISSSTASGGFVGTDDTFTATDYEVWAVSGDLSAGDSLDDADSQLEVAEFTLA